MISSAVSFRATLREPQPPAPTTGYGSPQDDRDAGWLGQVPPPSPAPARVPGGADASHDTLTMTGHESARDAREAGWLGQVPPPAPPREPSTPTAPSAELELGNETAHERREHGWLGQVPPPSAPTAGPVDDAPSTTYANPQLAPEPWKDSGSLFPDDPTLFG